MFNLDNANPTNNHHMSSYKKAKLMLKIDNTYYYNGDIDMYNYEFMGLGRLFKPDNYYYKGTFIRGKKDGYGYIFKDEKNGNYFFYMGEWKSNKPHGFGIAYYYSKEINKISTKPKKFLKGKFREGKFIAGQDIRIKEQEKIITIEKFIGSLKDDGFKSGEKLYKTTYKIGPEYKATWDVDSNYFYQGEFKNRFEHGQGLSVKTFPNASYRYYYKGEFQNGQMNGEGAILFEGNFFVKKYEGFFEKDKWFCNFGRVYFKSGDIYEGFFDSLNRKNLVGCYLHSKIEEKINRNEGFLLRPTEVIEITNEEFNFKDVFLSNFQIARQLFF